MDASGNFASIRLTVILKKEIKFYVKRETEKSKINLPKINRN